MMNEVLKAAYTCLQKNDPCVLVTAVRTKGSTPQKPGAKLLVRADGTATGTLGGGCMEGDLWYAAQQLLKDKGEPQFRQYTLNEEMAARDGLVCGGTMYFFLEPFFDSSFWQPLFKDILTGIETGPPLVVATIVQAPQHPDWVGKKILLHSDDSQSGDILNEEMEREIRSRGKKLAPVGGNQSFELSDGTEIFIEGFTAPSTLILMGGGHVNRMVVRLADLLGFRIIVIDDRSEFANKERFPEAECVIVADYSEGLKELSVR
ncbi:hypothetical protein GWN42_11530, partial [candidate division KSB1 bacterium]|nr:hypothetical protein [candidate division KSB1 bacterium]NIU28881.1 hypothetical protein [candidate division KSB1 bacterium]NIU91049.1 hypothetical protein [candidate division KSB1 bacterium]NIV93403.1 hypothetical protein [candidate division KSB1 bacterium]NIW22773.1 hypothetical protein [candidate division KSB1 bacterium]